MVKSRIIFVLLTVVGILGHSSVFGQTKTCPYDLPVHNVWWWGFDRGEIKDTILSRYGWQTVPREYTNAADWDFYSTLDENTNRSFAFYQDKWMLMQNWVFTLGSDGQKSFEQMLKKLVPVKVNKWRDTIGLATVTKRYDGNDVIYLVEYTP